MEDKLHQAEDGVLEEIWRLPGKMSWMAIHRQVCSGTDISIPTTYIAKTISEWENLNGDPIYEVTAKERECWWRLINIPIKTSRLVMIPPPAGLY